MRQRAARHPIGRAARLNSTLTSAQVNLSADIMAWERQGQSMDNKKLKLEHELAAVMLGPKRRLWQA
jgi:hypothetical protein